MKSFLTFVERSKAPLRITVTAKINLTFLYGRARRTTGTSSAASTATYLRDWRDPLDEFF